jgi:neurotransmitter:Na+ symporter, NSS family
MSRATGAHPHWSSRAGFILAAIGVAVGLGNLWRFSSEAGMNGMAVEVRVLDDQVAA